MDTNEAEGFFPERGLRRARRLRAMAEQPGQAADVRAQRTGMPMVLWIAVFVPVFVTPMLATSGWHGRIPAGLMEPIKFFLWLVLLACALCVPLAIWRNFRPRASPRASPKAS